MRRNEEVEELVAYCEENFKDVRSRIVIMVNNHYIPLFFQLNKIVIPCQSTLISMYLGYKKVKHHNKLHMSLDYAV